MAEDIGYHHLVGKKWRGPQKKYTPEDLWAKAYEYFEYMASRSWKRKDVIKGGDLAGCIIDVPVPTPFSLDSFCVYAGITNSTLLKYEKENEDYADVLREIKAIINAQHLEGGLTNIFHAGLAARKLGLADRQDITSGDERLAPPTIVFKASGGSNTKDE